MDHQLNYKIHTFGCKVNTYDAGLLQKRLSESGIDLKQASRVHILNTCAVTAEATKEATKSVRRLKAKDPFCTVVVTGCAAQVDTNQFENLKGADLVIANSHKAEIPAILDRYFKGQLTEKVFKSNIFIKDDLGLGGGVEKNHTRSFLKIQDGCNSFCTYCVIPFARGKSRSLTIKSLVQKINEVHSAGTLEVVLTGVHIGDYEDGGVGLEGLVEEILKQTKIPRIRLSSLEPVEVTDRLLALYSDERMTKHFHMSIQSASTPVLKDMKRNYQQQDVVESLLRIQKQVPNAFVGMDVIAGFPTETEETFEQTFETLEKLPWTRLHVFPYSVRPGTKAERFTGFVSDEEIKKRAARLRELSQSRFSKIAREQVGQVKQVLVLKKEAKGADGLSRDYWPVKITEAEAFIDGWRGQEVAVQISEVLMEPHREPLLVGHILETEIQKESHVMNFAGTEL